MLRTTKTMKEKYEKIQNYLFALIPEKWEGIYLYASVATKPYKDKTGELFFYYVPKGILKKKAINVYEVPQRFNLNEEQYLKIVEELYDCIKSLKQDFIDMEQDLWTNLTITIENLKFRIEYSYDELSMNEENICARNIIWRYKYLKIDGENRKERKILEEYFSNPTPKKREIYETGLYVKTDTNTVAFDKDETNNNNSEFLMYEKDDILNILSRTKNKNKEKQKHNIEDKREEPEEKRSKNQILNS